MSQKSSIYRTVEILKVLNDGKKLCISNLANDYEVSERTIRRDFELIRELFGDFMSKDMDCYQAYKKVLLDDVLNARDLMTLANIVNLFGITSMKSEISTKTNDLVKTSMSVYNFKSRPFENLSSSEVMKNLEHAIKFNKEIKIVYQTQRAHTRRLFQAYKILFLNENFYLVGENTSKNCFEFLRISMIVEVLFTKKVFNVKKDIKEFIEELQTPWASFGSKNILVRLRVDVKIRKYFMLKKYLPSQEIKQTFENGDIEVDYEVSNLKEIEELVVKWLPKISIISPKGLKKMIRKNLNKKLLSLK